jgi:hypothetical protein
MQLFPELTKYGLYGWFQQESATAHTAHVSMQALSDVFMNRIISSSIWPAHSPDLIPCDFFFWCCLKDRVYNSNPRTEELKKYSQGNCKYSHRTGSSGKSEPLCWC